ncbi:hypothetical protein [Streptomyces sp. S1]|uniref:hypothetical protein n=1 Tax=Streptomyces sp. S1 TaxID=718288 RepID=UPI003D72E880
MKNPFLGTGWHPPRRLVLAAGALVALLILATALALGTQSGDGTDAPRTQSAPASPHASASVPEPATKGGSTSAPGPPPLSDPLAFARASAIMLWSFDARTTRHGEQLAAMRTWVTSESAYADWDSIQAQIPDPVLWARLKDNAQHATATVSEAHFPSAFKRALAENPTAITEAYIYAVTVRGKARLVWTGGGSGAEDRQITLAVQCRPGTDCRLVAVAPNVAP